MTSFKKVILVGSGKGGVGKSTVSAALATGFAKRGLKVGLLDADIYGPSQDKIMNLESGKVNHSEEENILPTVDSFGVRCVSLGSLLAEHDALAWRAPMAISALKQMIDKTNWGDTEILIVDLPPGTGDVVMSAASGLKVSGAVVVSTPQDIALLDSKKAVQMFKKLNIPLLGLVENMSYYVCTSCGSKEHIFDNGSIEKLAQENDSLFLGDIPLNINIRQACDSGENLTKFDVFEDIVDKTLQRLTEVAQQSVKVVIE